jgi:hypothetical protein
LAGGGVAEAHSGGGGAAVAEPRDGVAGGALAAAVTEPVAESHTVEEAKAAEAEEAIAKLAGGLTAAQAKDQSASALQTAGEKVKQAASATSDAAEKTKDTTGKAWESTKQGTSDAAEATKEKEVVDDALAGRFNVC